MIFFPRSTSFLSVVIAGSEMGMLYTAVKQYQAVTVQTGIVILMLQGIAVQHDDFIFFSENSGKLIHDPALYPNEGMLSLSVRSVLFLFLKTEGQIMYLKYTQSHIPERLMRIILIPSE